MPSTTVDISEAMAALDTEKMVQTANNAIVEALDPVLEAVRKYPAPPAGSSYRRTGALGRGWTKKDDAKKGTSSLASSVPYVGYVQDQNMQARVHRGRWETVQSIMGRLSRQVTQTVERALVRWAD
ncbi:MAG: hypothetical protein GWN58_47360 [Anaerolineae bacterium]|nr:hypothetical protein [Anaerolineae bacterium]